MDHVANERLYGKPVEPSDILDGRLPPPNSFKQLIDTLNACEDGKFERHPSDADSDVSSQGVHMSGLDRALVSLCVLLRLAANLLLISSGVRLRSSKDSPGCKYKD